MNNSEKLKALKAAGVVPKSARWGKAAQSAAEQYERYFSLEKPQSGKWTTKYVSDAAADTLRGVNIPVIKTKYGNQMWFPLGAKSSVRVRETKHGVFVTWDSTKQPGNRAKENYYEIILKKGGNSFDHVKYAKKLDRKDHGYSYGKVRESVFHSASKGDLHAFTLDLTRLVTDPYMAAMDAHQSERLSWDMDTVSDGKIERTQSVTALIRNYAK